MFVISLVLALGSGTVSQAHTHANHENVASLAGRLAKIRGEVESLAAEMQRERQGQDSRHRALAEQRQELELQLRREGLRLEQLNAAKERQKSRLGDQQILEEDLKPALLATIRELRRYIHNGLPFRRPERLQILSRLEQQLLARELGVQTAAHRLWQAIEDEYRLGGENGIYRQTISVDGRSVLADVLRLGMVSLYYRANGSQQGGEFSYGYAHKDGATGEWAFLPFHSRADERRVAELFDAFKKQIRVGLFEIPNALIGEGGAAQ